MKYCFWVTDASSGFSSADDEALVGIQSRFPLTIGRNGPSKRQGLHPNAASEDWGNHSPRPGEILPILGVPRFLDHATVDLFDSGWTMMQQSFIPTMGVWKVWGSLLPGSGNS